MTILNLGTACLLAVGGTFLLAGTVGLLRFPDAHSRLHALSKADNLGLGLIIGGLMLQADSAALAVKLLIIWILVLLASGTACYLIANQALATREIPNDDWDDVRSRS